MTIADRASGIILLLFAAGVMHQASRLPYWAADAPGAGFLPFWLGALLGCLALALLAWPTSGPAKAAAAPGAPVMIVVALTSGAAALAPLAGLVLSSGVLTGATLAYLRPGHRRANAAAAVLTPIVVWLVFVRWLGVPLPAGPFGF